jgi:predicted ATPase
LQAHHSAGTTIFYRGEPALCREHSLAGRHLYDPAQHGSHASVYGGHDPGVCGANMLSFAEWLLGYPGKALTSSVEALAIAERLGHPFSWHIAYLWATVLHQFRREPDVSSRRLDAAERLAAEHRFALVFHPGILRGGILAAQGAIGEAVSLIREALPREGVELVRPYGLALLGDALRQGGDHPNALAAVADGLSAAAATGVRWWDAELHRLKGISLLAHHRSDEAQAAFEQALRVARDQQAKSLELRAATNLARLCGEQGRRAEARDLLAPVYGWFTEGFDTADLKEAKALLDELA